MRAKAKREATQGLKTGEIQLAVGTHALISDGVEFSSLALVTRTSSTASVSISAPRSRKKATSRTRLS